jgi:hypothetical protein
VVALLALEAPAKLHEPWWATPASTIGAVVLGTAVAWGLTRAERLPVLVSSDRYAGLFVSRCGPHRLHGCQFSGGQPLSRGVRRRETFSLLVLHQRIPAGSQIVHAAALVIVASILVHSSTDVVVARKLDVEERVCPARMSGANTEADGRTATQRSPSR